MCVRAAFGVWLIRAVQAPHRQGGAAGSRRIRPGFGRAGCAIAATTLAALLTASAGAPGGADAGAGCDRYASPVTAGGSGDGSAAAPYAGVERLVRELRSGQVGCLEPGTYRFSQLVIDRRNVTLAPSGAGSVRLRGEIKIPPSGAGSVIEGLILNGAGGRNEIGPRIYANRVVLRDNEITNRHRGICVHVGSWYAGPAPRGVVIERNRIHDCGRLPATNHDHGIYLSESRGAVIRDNWIYDNADRGIQLYPDARNSTIRGNVIHRNGNGIVFSGAGRHTSRGNLVAGNVIADSVRGWNVYSGSTGPRGSGNRLRGNCVHGASRDPYYRSHGGVQRPSRNFTARNNTVADPAFVARARGDLRLRGGSRCAAVLR
jgi:parallel beta-helix repeat protein